MKTYTNSKNMLSSYTRLTFKLILKVIWQFTNIKENKYRFNKNVKRLKTNSSFIA